MVRTRGHFPGEWMQLIMALLVFATLFTASSSARAQRRVEDFGKPAQSWVQMAELIDGGLSLFAEVAIGDNAVIVGDYSYNSYEGIAYVFVNSKSGWGYAGALTPSDGGGDFGRAVAMSGNTIVVGAYGRGEAYVFVKPAGGWTSMTETARLYPSTLPQGAYFGTSVAIAGSTIAVAASGSNSEGAGYVFVKPASGWENMSETAELTSTAFDFGEAIATNGETVAVAGSLATVFVYKKPSAGWKTTASFNSKLGGENGSGYGGSLAVGPNTVVVGAFRGLIKYPEQGAVYVYVETQSGWVESVLTASDATAGNWFGYSVAVSGNTIAVGSPTNQIGPNVAQGTSYIFVQPPSGWTDMTETAEIVASDGAANDEFGTSVAIIGNYVAVGGGYNVNFKDSAAYVFGPK